MRHPHEELTGASHSSTPSDSPGRWATAMLLLLVLVPTAFNAIALFSEFRVSIPSLNDSAFHFQSVQRASDALEANENVFDHWNPELDVGVPKFFYYQHLPHLAVLPLHRLLLKQVDLLTLFNLIRYLLLLGFPLTVYWSMRRMGFSVVAAAVAAATATLLSANHRYGFEYESYVWRGWGMYTQLWAMHLSFVTLACLHRVLERGTGYVAAVVAFSALALSHLMYGYMMAAAVAPLFFVGLSRMNLRQRIARLAATATLTAIITSYFWLPFLLFNAYFGVSPYEPRWKYDSFGADAILTWLINGDLLDYNRLPVLTLLLALGVASALQPRARLGRLALALLALWLVLFFGRATWGRLADLLPMHGRLHFHRFIGGVHLASILLIGLGGEWVWRQLAPLAERWRAVAMGLVLLVLLFPALRERYDFYSNNTHYLERTRKALDANEDARAILSAIKALPPGRAYAGRRDNWGKGVKLGDLHLFDLLTFHRIVAITPYEGYSLNADLIWHLDDSNPAHYDLFNVRYVVKPAGSVMPPFLRRIRETPRYTLYEADTSGYARFASVVSTRRTDSQSSLFAQNKAWLTSADPAAGNFIRWQYPLRKGASGDAPSGREPPVQAMRSRCPDSGTISEEQVLPGRLDVRVECQEPATLVLKMTYHPNWRVTIDGHAVEPFMASPSFIGLDLPAGQHQIRAEYRSPLYKTGLLLLGVCTLLATIWFRRRLIQLDAFFSMKRGCPTPLPH